MAHPYLLQTSGLQRPPVETALFDMFKVGPGPSSSHTIGPMKAGADFHRRCAALPDEVLARANAVHVTLLGSLSATGKGHGTDVAVLAGLLGHTPESCPPTVLPGLKAEPATCHAVRIGDREICVGLADFAFGPLQHDAPYSNTLRAELRDAGGKSLFDMEYYSVGGGFIQRKGYTEPERGKPVHPYGAMRELSARLHETGLTLHELILENETAITGMGRPAIHERLGAVMDAMYDPVGGYVQIPCIERNAMGAVKAGNAVLLATSEEDCQHLVSLDAAIMAMGEIGREMNVKFKETSGGGLAVSMVEC